MVTDVIKCTQKCEIVSLLYIVTERSRLFNFGHSVFENSTSFP